METLLNFLCNILPKELLIIAAISIASWILSRKITKWEINHKIEHENDKKEHENMNTSIKSHENRISQIDRFLVKNVSSYYDSFSQSNSPRQPNKMGEQLLKDSGADDLFDRIKYKLLDILHDEVVLMNAKTAYDVEFLSNKVCLYATSMDEFNPVKNFIYMNPVYNGKNISIETISMLFGLKLRDLYLADHAELSPL